MLDQLLSLPLEQKIGQLLYIGLPGTEYDAEARELVEYVRPGGVIIFGRNVATAPQLRGLLDGVRASSGVEPLLGVDQEGGLVDRLRRICTPMPAARSIRQHGDLAAARTLGRITGEVLRLLGFNMNFAPVLYSRSFGRSPGEVLGYTMVYLRGLQGTGCLGCAKHFPGIGAGEVDSHDEMPIIQLSHEDLIAQDLAPYIELFQREDNIVRAVMVSHGGFPKVDLRAGTAGGRLIPASINHQIVTKLLREELGYDGIVLTDDLEMGAIARHYQIEETVRLAIEAGEDMLLICARPELIRRGYDSLLQAARDRLLTEDRIDTSLRRIAAFKSLAQPPLPFDAARFAALSDEIAALNAKLNYTYGGKI